MITNPHLRADNRLLSRKKTKKSDYNVTLFLLFILQKTFQKTTVELAGRK